jgi:ribonuclease HI
MIDIYVDGAYSPLRDQGGIAFIIVEDNQEIFSYCKTFRRTTNNRMELLAAIIALESIKTSSEIQVTSDSQYLVATINENWKKNANRDLWKRLENIILFHKKVIFVWCKGHSSNQFNNKCDKLANKCSII